MAIFVIFWKINANMEPENLAKVAAKILEKGPHLEGREILA